MPCGWVLERSWWGEPAQQGLKIVHGDSPAENVLRFRDNEWRVPFLEGLQPQDLAQLREWRQLKCSYRCVEASTPLAEESDLANGPLQAGPAAWNGRDLGRIGWGTRGNTVWAAFQLGHGSHRIEPVHLGRMIRRRSVRNTFVVAHLRWAMAPDSEERTIPAHQYPLHVVQHRDNDLPA